MIEALLALAVFSSAAVVLTATFIATLELRDRARNDDLVHADIQTARLQLLLEPNRDDAEDGGRIETLSSGEVDWFAEIEPTNVVDLFTVRFTVEFAEPPEDQPRTHRETLHLLRPTWSESDERSTLLEDKKSELENHRDFDRF